MNLNEKIIKNKLGLLKLGEELGNVSKACEIMGFSRDTFYRYKSAVDEGGVSALLEKNRRQPNLKNRTDEATEQAIIEVSLDNPALGQLRVSNELRKRGIIFSPSGVRSVWIRNNLTTFQKRLSALEKKVSEENIILTDIQLSALEKKKDHDEAHGEIETIHPGYLGSQDTFYVGTLKGVGRIYQQTFVDTYSRLAICKLYTTKTPLASADLLNDKVMPFFEKHGMSILRMLTDRGTEYNGKLSTHAYELYLAINDIDHTKTKVRHPQTNGICERFHKTILNEFYQITFRKKLYTTLEELQIDLDQWLIEYNDKREHQGKMCCGRTPMQTFNDGKVIYKEKVDNLNLTA